MENKDIYNDKFYEGIEDYYSPQVVLPLILDAVKPKSVLDVGCGQGIWLSVCKKLGVENITGIDGDYVNKEKLAIPKECFMPLDLENKIDLKNKYDLTISLEVGEHLKEECSDDYVKLLSESSDVILFSAAVPYQHGENHINCQWPSYWIEKFQKYDFVAIDFIRPQIQTDLKIAFPYRQNIFILVRENCLSKYPKLENVRHLKPGNQIVGDHLDTLLYSFAQSVIPPKVTFLEKLFSIKKEKKYKVVRILGIKFGFKMPQKPCAARDTSRGGGAEC